MKKRNIIIISSIVTALVIIIAVTAFLNAENIEEKKTLEKEAIIQVNTGGYILGEINMELI